MNKLWTVEFTEGAEQKTANVKAPTSDTAMLTILDNHPDAIFTMVSYTPLAL